MQLVGGVAVLSGDFELERDLDVVAAFCRFDAFRVFSVAPLSVELVAFFEGLFAWVSFCVMRKLDVFLVLRLVWTWIESLTSFVSGPSLKECWMKSVMSSTSGMVVVYVSAFGRCFQTVLLSEMPEKILGRDTKMVVLRLGHVTKKSRQLQCSVFWTLGDCITALFPIALGRAFSSSRR